MKFLAGSPWRMRPTTWLLEYSPALWLDSTFGLFQERTGASATTPAAAHGDPVGTWRARTGQNFVAPADGQRPTLRSNTGLAFVDFDNTDDQMDEGSANNVPYTWFLVEETKSVGAGSRTLTSSGGDNRVLSISRNSGNSFFVGGSVSGNTPGSAGRHTAALVVPSGSNCIAYLNNVNVTSGSVAGANWGALRLGFGGTGGATEKANTFVRHIVKFDRVLTLGELSLLHAWGKTF